MPDDDLAYLRQPTIHGEAIVFVADDDLWSVPAAGGLARRLTAGLSEPSTPCLSPDGKWLAFVGRDEQHPEVCVMPAEGGPARRLTWLGTDVIVRGWTPAGEIVYVTTHGQPFFRNYQGFVIDAAGGTPRALPFGQVNHLAFGPGERKVIGRNTADPARWKRYRGGTAGALWIDAEGVGTFRRMSELGGNVTSPMWIGGRVWYLGDAEGVGNLYSCRPDGSDIRRHTDHEAFYARHAQRDGKRNVYQCGAKLWLFDPATDATRELAIRTPAHRAQAARKFVPAGEHLESFHLHPEGHSLALAARGQLFGMALWEGAARRFADGDAGRTRHGQWLADGTALVAVSDASGEERVVVFAGYEARTLPWDVGHVTRLRAAPKGSAVAIANHRNEVLIGDLESGALTKVDASEFGRSDDLAWSPDAAWLAYTFATSTRHVAIKLHGVAGRTSTLVTEPEFRDYSPSFDPEGKYLYFLSLRTYDPVYDSVQFELSFPRAARPYLIALQAGGRPPFEAEPKGLKADAAKGADAARATLDAAPLRIDLDGIAARVAAFPVSENRFDRLAGAAGRKVVWSVQNIVGAHGRGGHKEAAGKLEIFDFTTGRTETLADKADAFELAHDGTTLVLRDGKRLRAIAADKKPAAKAEASEGDGPPSRKNGWIDLERLRLSVEPRREWRQMLREVWRLQRDQFWSADMSGVDWDAVYRNYAPLVEQATTRADLSDLIWEMQGELGTSHAYEMGGDHRKPPLVALGYLGAELRFDAGDSGWEITRIVRGDPWDASADSPLNAVGVEAQIGERIVAVGGLPVSAELPPQALLVHQAGAKVQLTLKRGTGRGDAARGDGDDAGRRGAGALSRMGREEPRLGACAIAGPRRLLPPARHDGRGLRRVPSLLRRRMRARGARCRRALQPRRPRLAAAAREGRAPPHRLQPFALGAARHLSGRSGRRSGGGADQRARRLRRRHLLAQLQADEDRPARRHAHLGRRRRHLAAAHAGRRHADDAAGVRLLVQRRRLGHRELRHRPRHRGRQRAAGPCRRARPPARDRSRDGAGEDRRDRRAGSPRRAAAAPRAPAAAAATARLTGVRRRRRDRRGC